MRDVPDVNKSSGELQGRQLQQWSDIQHIWAVGIHGGYPSQQSSMVVQPESTLNVMTQGGQ